MISAPYGSAPGIPAMSGSPVAGGAAGTDSRASSWPASASAAARRIRAARRARSASMSRELAEQPQIAGQQHQRRNDDPVRVDAGDHQPDGDDGERDQGGQQAAARLEHLGPPRGRRRRGDLCVRGGRRPASSSRASSRKRPHRPVSPPTGSPAAPGRPMPAAGCRPGVLARTSWLAPVGVGRARPAPAPAVAGPRGDAAIAAPAPRPRWPRSRDRGSRYSTLSLVDRS